MGEELDIPLRSPEADDATADTTHDHARGIHESEGHRPRATPRRCRDDVEGTRDELLEGESARVFDGDG